jgi:hypothetical protein
MVPARRVLRQMMLLALRFCHALLLSLGAGYLAFNWWCNAAEARVFLLT